MQRECGKLETFRDPSSYCIAYVYKVHAYAYFNPRFFGFRVVSNFQIHGALLGGKSGNNFTRRNKRKENENLFVKSFFFFRNFLKMN